MPLRIQTPRVLGQPPSDAKGPKPKVPGFQNTRIVENLHLHTLLPLEGGGSCHLKGSFCFVEPRKGFGSKGSPKGTLPQGEGVGRREAVVLKHPYTLEVGTVWPWGAPGRTGDSRKASRNVRTLTEGPPVGCWSSAGLQQGRSSPSPLLELLVVSTLNKVCWRRRRG